MVLLDKESTIQQKIFSQNPSFTEEQQLTIPFMQSKKGLKNLKPIKSSNINQTKAFEEVTNTQNNKANHPLAAHPCFKPAFDRLCGNTVNLLNLPGKLDIKPYFKDALVKKTPFDGIEMKEKMEDGVYKVIF